VAVKELLPPMLQQQPPERLTAALQVGVGVGVVKHSVVY
jgi:hypothetical protein